MKKDGMDEGIGMANVSGKAGAPNKEAAATRPTQHYHGTAPFRLHDATDGKGTQTSENPKKKQGTSMRYF